MRGARCTVVGGAVVCLALASGGALATIPAGVDPPEAGAAAAAREALEAGDLDRAESLFRQLLSAPGSGSVSHHLGLAAVLELQGDPVAALATSRSAAQLDPDAYAALLLTGRLLARLGAVGEALDWLDRASAAAPSRTEPYLVSATLLADAGRLDEAIERLEGVPAEAAADPALRAELGLRLLEDGRAREAHEIALKSLESHPENARLLLVAGLGGAESSDQVSESVGYLESALAAGVADPERVRLRLADLLLAEDPGRALELLALAEEERSGDAQLFYRKATALRALGDLDAAAQALERYSELSAAAERAETAAKELGIAFNEAQSLANENRLAEALEGVKALLVEHPGFARARALEAKVLFSLGRAEEAVEAIVRAREADPGRTELHYLEGVFLTQLQRSGEAEKAVARALALSPGLAEGYALLGVIQAQQGRPLEAIEQFDRALELGVENPSLHLSYANVLESLGRSAESAEQMELFRRLRGES